MLLYKKTEAEYILIAQKINTACDFALIAISQAFLFFLLFTQALLLVFYLSKMNRVTQKYTKIPNFIPTFAL